MDEKSDQIVNHIEDQRNQLGRNLDELEHRVSETMDWRAQFNRHPAAMMGAALGGGLLLGALMRGASSPSRRSAYRSSWSESSSVGSSSSMGASSSSASSSMQPVKRSSPAVSMQRQRASETFENIKGALIGYGIAQLKNFLLGALPGFERHYNETEQRHSMHQSSGQWTPGASAPYGTQGYGTTGTYGSSSSGGAGHQSSGSGGVGHQGSGTSSTADQTHHQPTGNPTL